MKIVVTGASGFIGRALMKKLAQTDNEVIGVSRNSASGYFYVEDYANSPDGDVLIHLGEASNRKWVEKSGQPYEKSAMSTLEHLMNKKYGRVVYASSSVLYGDQNSGLSKVCDHIKITDAYSRIKAFSESKVLEKKGVVARLANVYGEDMSEENVFSTILNQLSTGASISICDSTPVRDFIYVEDAADALVNMSTGDSSGVYNVGTGEGTSILQLIQIILEEVNRSDWSIESTREKTRRHSQLIVDIDNTVADFNWSPKTSLQLGVKILIDKMKDDRKL